MESISVVLTRRQKSLLERIARSKLAAQQLVERCRIILLSAEGRTNISQAFELGIDRQRVRRWRHRWASAAESLLAAEAKASDKDFEAVIVGLLADDARSGAPPKFSPEQIAELIALACEPPSDSGLPVSHWTPSELASEAAKRGFVETISPRQVDRFLARRTCDRTEASTGSHRGTSVKTLSNTKPTSNGSVTRTETRHSLRRRVAT
jgi:putative transposase